MCEIWVHGDVGDNAADVHRRDFSHVEVCAGQAIKSVILINVYRVYALANKHKSILFFSATILLWQWGIALYAMSQVCLIHSRTILAVPMFCAHSPHKARTSQPFYYLEPTVGLLDCQISLKLTLFTVCSALIIIREIRSESSLMSSH